MGNLHENGYLNELIMFAKIFDRHMFRGECLDIHEKDQRQGYDEPFRPHGKKIMSFLFQKPQENVPFDELRDTFTSHIIKLLEKPDELRVALREIQAESRKLIFKILAFAVLDIDPNAIQRAREFFEEHYEDMAQFITDLYSLGYITLTFKLLNGISSKRYNVFMSKIQNIMPAEEFSQFYQAMNRNKWALNMIKRDNN